MKNPNRKILIFLSIACILGLFAYLSPTLAKVINFGTGSDTSYFPGNIGIGATTTDKLNISGSLRVTGTTTLSSYAGGGNQCLYVDNSGIIRLLGSQCGSATGGDNLGNHTATQALNLGANALVGNGGSTGITITSGGAVSVANGFTLSSGTLSLPGSSVTDAMVSDTLTASNLVAGGSVVSDTEVDNNISIISGTIGSNNISSASTWTTLGTLTIGDNGDAVLMSATNWDVDSSGNIFANGGISTYDTTITDGYVEAAGLCLGNGTNCITSWTNVGGSVNASSPTANYVTKFSDSDTLANSTIFDTGTYVGIGTTTPSTAKLVVVGSVTNYNIDAGSKPITNLATPLLNNDSATKNYVDSAVAGVSGSGGYWLTASSSAIYASSTITSVGIGTTSPSAPFEVYGGFYMGGGSGDVDSSGVVNATDALYAAQFVNGVISLTPLQQANADVDGDGIVTIFDSRNILKRFVNMYTSRNQMNSESRRIKSMAVDYDGAGKFILGNVSNYSTDFTMRDHFTVFGTSLMDTTASSTFNPTNSTSSALMLTGPYGGGLIFKDTAYGGLWMSDSGQTLNFASNGSGSGFGSSYGQMVLKNSNVGIGTTSPSQKLDVWGSIALNGTKLMTLPSQATLTGSLIYGTGGSSLTHTTGVTGTNNTLIGIQAGLNLTSGHFNTAQGAQALWSNTTGYSNTAQGTQSLYSNLGSTNTAQGVQSLFSNIGGSSNTAQGVESLYFNTSGNFNTAQGWRALFSNTEGGTNTAQGTQALYWNTTGSNNVAVGYYAGGWLADGATARSTGQNGLYLGSESKASANGTTNEIVIGYNAIGAGSNSIVLGNTNITKTILRANVGIGTTNPTRPLDVVGNVQVTSGSVTADAFYYNSDRTLKKDIKPINGALSKVLNLQGVSFKWRSSNEPSYGFIAQDVEKITPELVELGPDGTKSVAYGNFTAILVEAMKAQQKEINSLQARVKALEGRLKQFSLDFRNFTYISMKISRPIFNQKMFLVMGLILTIFLIILVIVDISRRGKKEAVKVYPEQANKTGEIVIPVARTETEPSPFRAEVPANTIVPEMDTDPQKITDKEIVVPSYVAQAAPGIESKFRIFDIKGEGNEYNPSKIIARVGDTVHVNFTAVDKDYDIVFPDYAMSQQAKLGQTKILEFQALQEGDFLYYCQACGGPNSKTVGHIIIVNK